MKAVVFDGAGGPEVVRTGEIPEPIPARGEVLVRVRAAALNRADLLQRRGQYAPPAGTRADVPGLELAGEVLRAGEGVTAWRPGDRVMAICAGEGQAELAVVHERMLLRIPDRLSYEQAGALPEAGITAHDALFTVGGLRPGWTVLVHSVGSGVATLALQLAKAAGATVIGTSRTEAKLVRARALGLDHGILVARDGARFADEVRRLTDGDGCPLVVDFAGASYAQENVAALAMRGVLVVVGTMGGADARTDLRALMSKRAAIVGTTLRMRPLEEKIAATQAFARDVLPLVASGRVAPVVDSVLPLERAREAHERMERNDSFGKLVLAL
ncbi:MAG TPA: NAD(P)H-quinone oxidoreductase [Anaeromyxobacter sp.]